MFKTVGLKEHCERGFVDMERAFEEGICRIGVNSVARKCNMRMEGVTRSRMFGKVRYRRVKRGKSKFMHEARDSGVRAEISLRQQSKKEKKTFLKPQQKIKKL